MLSLFVKIKTSALTYTIGCCCCQKSLLEGTKELPLSAKLLTCLLLLAAKE